MTFVLFCALFGLLLSGCEADNRTPDRYLIPQGYTGWIVVQYGVKGAPPLPVENGFRLYRIPRNGRLKTSSTILYGRAMDEYYYVLPNGQRQRLKETDWGGGGRIWGGSVGSGESYDANGKLTEQSPETKIDFIGTEKQFKKAGPEPEPMH